MDNLRILREEKRISQQRLAEIIGTNQQNIHRYEHGFYEPDIQALKLHANFFDTSIDFLVGNTVIRRKIEEIERFDLNEEPVFYISDKRNGYVKIIWYCEGILCGKKAIDWEWIQLINSILSYLI